MLVEQVIPSNPVDRAKRPRRQPTEPGEIWTAAELRTVLKAAHTHRLFTYFHLAAYNGARREELLNLRWRAHRGDDQEQPIPRRELDSGTVDVLFAAGWGEPVRPDTVSSLMTS